MPWTKVMPEVRELEWLRETDHTERLLAYPQAIREALDQALTIDQRVFIMGQGVDDPGGMFGTTKGLHIDHGPERCFDTPLAEAGMTGIAIGAALGGMRPVYMHNRPDFLFLTLDQLINHAAKWHYMFAGAMSVPLVVWACTGRGWGSGAQHSQSLQGTMMQYPGLKVAMPSTAYDTKGLLLAAIADENPVLILEHRHNFKYKGDVPENTYTVPLGKGAVRREGADVTIVGISNMVNEALLAAEELAAIGIDCEVVDLRSLRPLDEDLVLESLRKTGRLVVTDNSAAVGGVAAEIAAIAAGPGHAHLKAPVQRVTNPDVPTPSGYTLEAGFYVGKDEIIQAVRTIA